MAYNVTTHGTTVIAPDGTGVWVQMPILTNTNTYTSPVIPYPTATQLKPYYPEIAPYPGPAFDSTLDDIETLWTARWGAGWIGSNSFDADWQIMSWRMHNANRAEMWVAHGMFYYRLAK